MWVVSTLLRRKSSDFRSLSFLYHRTWYPLYSICYTETFLGQHKLSQPVSLKSKCMLIGASMVSNPQSDKARSRVEIIATETDEENHGSAIITFLDSGIKLKLLPLKVLPLLTAHDHPSGKNELTKDISLFNLSFKLLPGVAAGDAADQPANDLALLKIENSSPKFVNCKFTALSSGKILIISSESDFDRLWL